MAKLSTQGMDLLRTGAAQLGITLSEKAIDLFAIFYRELIRWNRTTSLTAITAEKDVVIKHFLDSLSPLGLNLSGPLIDVGTGAGFPGVPIKIVRPDMEVTLVERSAKRVLFLKHLARALQLTDLKIVEGDATAIGKSPEFHQRFNLVISRATYSLLELAKLASPLLAPGGKVVAMKGPRYIEELSRFEAEPRSHLMVEQIVPMTLPFSGEKRVLVVMEARA